MNVQERNVNEKPFCLMPLGGFPTTATLFSELLRA